MKFSKYKLFLRMPDLPGYEWVNYTYYTQVTRLVVPPRVGDEITIDDILTTLVVVRIHHWACISDTSKKIGKGVPELDVVCELLHPESYDPVKLKSQLELYEWQPE